MLAEIHDLDDALALTWLFEHGDTLFANGLPVDALITGAAFLSERGLAHFLVTHLGMLGEWDYMQLYSRGPDAEPRHVDDLIERCRDAGVELHHRPDLPTPWKVVLQQLATDSDLAAFAILASSYSANSWWFDLDDVARPRAVEIEATPEQLADLIARCRRAGVVMRPL